MLPPSIRGGRSSIKKILETVAFARDVAHFEPDAIVIDGFDLGLATDDALVDLANLAKERNVELWLAANVDKAPSAGPGLPEPLGRFEAQIAVVVYLVPERDLVHLRLLKDHGNADVAELSLRLDAHSMRILEEDVPPPSARPCDPRRFRLHSGGSKGAEAAFGACAEEWGVSEINFSFVGHSLRERSRGVVVLSEDEPEKGTSVWFTCPSG